MFNDITLLMTGVGGPGALGYISALKNNGERRIKIIGTDIRSDIDQSTLDGIDDFYIIPKANTTEYLSSVLELCRRNHVDVLLPLNTAELNTLSDNISAFNVIGVSVCVMDPSILRIANNKAELLKKLHGIGIKTPHFRIVNSIQEFKDAAKDLGYPNNPICIKRPDGNGSRGVRFIDPSVSEADAFLYSKPGAMNISYEAIARLLPDVFKKTALVVMEYLPGKEYSVDCLVDNGNTVAITIRRVDAVVGSIDVDATVVSDERIEEYCFGINKALCLDGCIGYGLRLDCNGDPLILEINPRLQATTILSVISGNNYPYYAVKHALGEKVTAIKNTEGLRISQRVQRRITDNQGNIVMEL